MESTPPKESSSSRPPETPAQRAAKAVFVLTSLAVVIYASMRHVEVGSKVLAVFLIQWACFTVAAYYRTEKFYDLAGSCCFLYLSITSWLGGSRDLRSSLVCGCVAVWALRLGSFLVYRVHRDGKDRRFDTAKKNLILFFVYWTLQGLWVSTTALQLLLLSTSSAPTDASLPPAAAVGCAVWALAAVAVLTPFLLLGFALQVVADFQKLLFRNNRQNADKFIQSGVWRYCRHPNYFGEMILWAGVTLAAVVDSPLATTDLFLACYAPFFVFFLLSFVSGVPLLEHSAEKKWGALPDYQAYKRQSRVVVCLPFPAS